MVMTRSRRRSASDNVCLAAVLVLLLGASSGCEGTGVVLAESEEPFLYVALTPASTSRLDPGVYALLLTAGTPLAATYRSAERFELRRADDGAVFGWRELPKSGVAPGGAQGVELREGNFFLSDTAAAGLSARDIRPGERYHLQVETGEAVVRGSVTVPDSFSLRYEVNGGNRTIRWDPVAGASGYLVEITPFTPAAHQSGTSFVLPDRTPAAFRARVHALDPALNRYMIDGNARRSGIDRGYGVLGAFTTAVLTFAP